MTERWSSCSIQNHNTVSNTPLSKLYDISVVLKKNENVWFKLLSFGKCVLKTLDFFACYEIQNIWQAKEVGSRWVIWTYMWRQKRSCSLIKWMCCVCRQKLSHSLRKFICCSTDIVSESQISVNLNIRTQI